MKYIVAKNYEAHRTYLIEFEDRILRASMFYYQQPQTLFS